MAYSLAIGKAAAVTQESGEVAACSLAREGRRRQSLALRPGQREKLRTVVGQKQLPSAGLAYRLHAHGMRPEDHVSNNY